MRIWAVVLAAGEGSRLGGGKLTLPFGRGTIISEVVDRLEQMVESGLFDGITVVVGFHGEQVRLALRGSEVKFVENPNASEGMLSSVKCGIASLPDDVEAALIVLGDQPLVDADAVGAIIAAASTSSKLFFIPRYDGKRGHPILMRKELFGDIARLPKELGLNALRSERPDTLESVDVRSLTILSDVDTLADYERLVGFRGS